MTEIPTHVTTQQLAEACKALGLDVRDVVELHVFHNRIEVERLVKASPASLTPGGYMPTRARVGIPVCDGCSHPDPAENYPHTHRPTA